MVLKGVIIHESLDDPSILKDFKIVKTESEKVTPKHRTPWLTKWTCHRVEIDDSDIDSICQKIQEALDKNHEWYIELKNNRYEITIFNDRIIKKKLPLFSS
jgi:hypothetical protein